MLEQANDTKELNRVQRRLATGGKVVGKFVNCSVTVGLAGVTLTALLPAAVDRPAHHAADHQVINRFSPYPRS